MQTEWEKKDEVDILTEDPGQLFGRPTGAPANDIATSVMALAMRRAR